MKGKWKLAFVAAAVAVASLATAAQAGADTFSNTSAISINDGSEPCPVSSGPAAPYPSTIAVSGLAGTIADVNVTLTGLSHTHPDDVDVLLVGPGGEKTILMGSAGAIGASDVDLTFDDGAAESLPDIAGLVSGSFKPTIGATDQGSCPVPGSFPLPAPPGPYGAPSLAVFNSTNANGTWSLYVIDDTAADAGSIDGGWSLDITVQAADPEQAIADLRDLVAGFGIQPGTANALDRKLEDALAALAADDTAGACDSLQAFLNQVAAQNGKKLTEAQAEPLTDAANEIRALLDS